MTSKIPREKYIRVEKTTKNQDDFRVLATGITCAVFILIMSMLYNYVKEQQSNLLTNEPWEKNNTE